MGVEFPLTFPQDFCGNSHIDPQVDSHMDSHIGFHKGKLLPIPNGHGKLGIPIPMTNLVIIARATFLQKGPAPNSRQVCPNWTHNNLYLVSPKVAVGIGIPMKIPMGIPMVKSDPHSHGYRHSHGYMNSHTHGSANIFQTENKIKAIQRYVRH